MVHWNTPARTDSQKTVSAYNERAREIVKRLSFRVSSYLFVLLRELAFIMVQCCFHGSFLTMLSRNSTPIPAIPRSQPNRRQLTRSDSFPTPIQNTKTVSGLGALSGCQLVSVPYARRIAERLLVGELQPLFKIGLVVVMFKKEALFLFVFVADIRYNELDNWVWSADLAFLLKLRKFDNIGIAQKSVLVCLWQNGRRWSVPIWPSQATTGRDVTASFFLWLWRGAMD